MPGFVLLHTEAALDSVDTLDSVFSLMLVPDLIYLELSILCKKNARFRRHGTSTAQAV